MQRDKILPNTNTNEKSSAFDNILLLDAIEKIFFQQEAAEGDADGVGGDDDDE